MATEKQVAANRASSRLSTGPSEASLARTRFIAVKHGMAGELAEVEAAASDTFADRKQKWGAIYRPAGDPGAWALDQAVAASLRIEAFGRTIQSLVDFERARATVAWGLDRAVEAATTFGRLARDSLLVARQLETTLDGVRLLLDAWLGLLEPLEAGRDWSDEEASKALDLLGVAPDRRSGRTPMTTPEAMEALASRQAVTRDEIDRLEAVRDEAMTPLDEMNRRIAVGGELALLSKPAQLTMRYERDAWRRYREAMKVLQAPARSPTPAPLPKPKPLPVATLPPAVAPTPPTVAARPSTAPVAPRPAPRDLERNEANSDEASREERRRLLDQAAAILAGFTGLPRPTDEDEEAEWLEEAERRLHAPATERSQIGAIAVGPV